MKKTMLSVLSLLVAGALAAQPTVSGAAPNVISVSNLSAGCIPFGSGISGLTCDATAPALWNSTTKTLTMLNLMPTNALPAAGGGTGLTSPGPSGNVLTSNGTNWTSAAPAGSSYPGSGIAVSTGSAWSTSLTAPSSAIVGISDSQALSNKSFGSGMTWPTFNQNTSGTAANVTGTVATTNGGTGLTASGAAGNLLTSTGSVWQSTPGMALNAAPGNGNYSAPKYLTGQTAGAALAAGDVVYFKSDGKWYDAKADAAATSGPVLLGMCPAAIGSGATGVIVLEGVVEKTGWGLTEASTYYVSTATAGAMQTAAPSTSGQQVRVTGQALSTVDFYFHPSPDWGQI
jgi:hypothetical protein